MTVELKGKGGYISMHRESWGAVEKIACELGWTPEYEADELGYRVPQHNARALAKALYRTIQAIGTDSLSDTLVEHLREAGVGNMRDIADIAYVGGFYID
jgi:hypothetical protein